MPTHGYDYSGVRAATDAASRAAVAAVRSYEMARSECAALVPPRLALDSADAVYGAALARLGLPQSDIRELSRYGTATVRAAFRRMQHGGARQTLATDAQRSAREKRFPNANRLG